MAGYLNSFSHLLQCHLKSLSTSVIVYKYLFVVFPNEAESAPTSVLFFPLFVIKPPSFTWAEGHPAEDYIFQVPLQLDITM